jgi:hypothetical protein
MSDGAIDAAVEHVPQMRGAFSAAYFDASGGAISRVAASATAFAGREAAYGFHVLAGWMDAAEDESVMAWAGELHRAMTPHATGGVYVMPRLSLLRADREAHRRLLRAPCVASPAE